jgi:PAS domain S-box-containing protein
VLESLLHSPEYNLVRATSAEKALMLLLDGIFAVIVLDIQMPEMSGLELANLIKQRRRTQHIPIIFLTAYFQDDKDVLQGYGTGAVDYLTKPVNPQILRSKIAVFVDLFRKTQALAIANAALELEVAQRQQAEESLRQSNNELEARVAARTAELTRVNEELHESRELVHRELAEQKRIESALRASEAQLRLVTDEAPVFIAQIDAQHRFKFVNRTCARLFGAEVSDLLGRHVMEVLGEDAYEVIRGPLDQALQGDRVEFEAQIPFASQGRRWMYIVHEPERDGLGTVIGLVAVVTDITERKHAEQEIAAARDQALAASRAKDEFLARLSHELRTPLNPVLLLASEAAGNADLPPPVRADFELIAQNVTLEARLIDDLLDLTAITRGKLSIERRPVLLHTVIRDAIGMVRQEIADKQIQLSLQLDAPRHTVAGDDMRLRQIFWNVVKNAVKFTPPSGRVSIATSLTPDQERIQVSITDSGIGLTAEESARIFSAFAQGDHASNGSGRFGGLGLGLVISRMLVQLHTGAIRASSPGRNQGATFTIELPLAPEPVATGSRPGPALLDGMPLKANAPRPLRILLVEDHAPTCQTLAGLLTRRRYDVVTAGTVGEAGEAVRQQSFDLVISDIGLPDGNGCELMADLRARYGLRGVALTGYGMEDDVARTLESGFVTHLTKPVSIRALDEALLKLVAAAPDRASSKVGTA